MKIRSFLVALVALFSANAYAVHCEGNFTFSGGGSGFVSYDTPFGQCAGVELATVSNLVISITIGATTWNQSQLTAKYQPPTLGRLSFGFDGTTFFWDDPDDGSGDTGIAIFTNGGQVLAFDEGDLGQYTFTINGQPGGTYTLALFAFAPQVPALSPIGMALLGLLIAGVAFAMRGRFRRGGGNTLA